MIIPSLNDDRDFVKKIDESFVFGQYSLKEFRGPILNQSRNNSCTGFGTAGMVNSYIRKTFNSEKDLVFQMSPMDLWYHVRKINGDDGKNIGAYPRDIMSYLVKTGFTDSRLFDPKDKDSTPPDSLPRVKFNKFERIDLSDFELVKKIISYIICVEKNCIGFCIRCDHYAYRDAAFGGVFRPDSRDYYSDGYHWIYADEVSNEGVTLVNSYGEGWGNKGTCLMTWECFVKKMVVEAWTLDRFLQ